jgi:hypothetical protein
VPLATPDRHRCRRRVGGVTAAAWQLRSSDLLDFLDTKKKLPGERKLFSEKRPGAGRAEEPVQGPSRSRSINRTPRQRGRRAAAENRAATQSRGKYPPRQPGSKPAAPDPDVAAEEDGSTAAAPPPPKPAKIIRRTTAPPPDQPAAQSVPAAQSNQQSGLAFPAPLPSGTFTR